MARIAVIGAGMGALAASARLATAGHRVTVYERRRTHGGAVGGYEREGFTFDTGPGLLNLPAVYRDLFVKTGRETLEQSVQVSEVDPAARHVFADGTELILPNASRAGVAKALDAGLGAGAGERWNTLMNRAREVWEATRRPLLEEPLGDRTALARDPYLPEQRSGLIARLGRGTPRGESSLARVAERELGHPGLVALLEEYALRHGYDPRTAPASLVALPYMEQTFGTWYVQGGIRALADAVFRRCVQRGVDFRFDAGVARIILVAGSASAPRAGGVELADGTRAEADAVVCGADARALLHGEGESAPSAAADGPDAVPPCAAMGRFTVLLALDGPRAPGAAHLTVVHAADRAAELAALFSGDDALCDRPTVRVLRPAGEREGVSLTVTVPPHGEGGVDWARPGLAESYADRVLDAVAPLGLAARVRWREVRTPADTERETGAPGGRVPGPALAGRGGGFLRPDNRSTVSGLYLVGGFAHPGGGLPHAGMSGAIAAGLIGAC